MTPLQYPLALQELITQLKRMPGTGSRGAERLALWFLQHGQLDAAQLAEALLRSQQEISPCPQCGFFSEQGELCAACADPRRDNGQICVVEQATDVLPIERCGLYKGRYHCLGGKISPLDGIMPEDLRIASLKERLSGLVDAEVILAVGSDVEGEATALYLADELAQSPCKVTRLAQGMPAGVGLGNADSVTLMRALEGRQSY